MEKRLYLAIGLALGLVLTPPAVWAGVVSAFYPSVVTLTSTAPSGVNGFACRTTGCRVDLGPNASDYLYASSAAQIETPSNIKAAWFTAGGSIFTNGALRLSPGLALVTCDTNAEGYVYRLTGTGGTGTLSQTRLCACVSDGAASPVFSWRRFS